MQFIKIQTERAATEFSETENSCSKQLIGYK